MAATAPHKSINEFPEDLLTEVARYLRPSDLRAYLISCKNYHDALAPLLYRKVHINIPTTSFLRRPDTHRPTRVLSGLVASLRRIAGPLNDSSYPQHIRSLVYISYDSATDIRALPLLAMVIKFASNLRHVQIDVPQGSIPLAVSVLRRHAVVWVSPGDIFVSITKPKNVTSCAPRLESIRSTKVAIVAALMEQRPLTTVAVDHGNVPSDLRTLLSYSSHPVHTSLTRLSLGVIGQYPQVRLVIHAIAVTFPQLQHLAVRCGTRLSGGLIDAVVDLFTEHEDWFKHLRVLTLNHGARGSLYHSRLESAMPDIRKIGSGRQTLVEFAFGRSKASRGIAWEGNGRWILTGEAAPARWEWLMRASPRWP